MAMLNWSGSRETAPEDRSMSQSTSSANEEPEPPLIDHLRQQHTDEPEGDLEDEDFELYSQVSDLPPTDLAIMREARTEQRRQAGHPAYSPGGSETFIDEDTGRATVAPKFAAATFEELLTLAKIRRAEEAARRDRGVEHTPEPSNRVRELLARGKATRPVEERPRTKSWAEVRPRTKSWVEWFRNRIAPPKKPQWR